MKWNGKSPFPVTADKTTFAEVPDHRQDGDILLYPFKGNGLVEQSYSLDFKISNEAVK